MRQQVYPMHLTLAGGFDSLGRVVSVCNKRQVSVHSMTFSAATASNSSAAAVLYVRADLRSIDLLRRQLDRLVDVLAVIPETSTAKPTPS